LPASETRVVCGKVVKAFASPQRQQNFLVVIEGKIEHHHSQSGGGRAYKLAPVTVR
jgi:hypothetical protein